MGHSPSSEQDCIRSARHPLAGRGFNARNLSNAGRPVWRWDQNDIFGGPKIGRNAARQGYASGRSATYGCGTISAASNPSATAHLGIAGALQFGAATARRSGSHLRACAAERGDLVARAADPQFRPSIPFSKLAIADTSSRSCAEPGESFAYQHAVL
jgi:hypothetical protein